ncbi:MAG: ArsI/CadI family heavy metal resistance metalloenzyme [Candidatus Binataceae bacterium]
MTNRVHIHLHPSDLENSRRFYEQFFGAPPVKARTGYFKFLPEFAPVNLALTTGAPADADARTVGHLGLQLESSEIVEQHLARVMAAGLPVDVERNVNCCHANQDKFWVTDPDGVRWEVYHLNYDLEDGDVAAEMAHPRSLPIIDQTACCTPATETASASAACCGAKN